MDGMGWDGMGWMDGWMGNIEGGTWWRGGTWSHVDVRVPNKLLVLLACFWHVGSGASRTWNDGSLKE